MEANQLADVTELSRRLVRTFPTGSAEAGAVTTALGEAGYVPIAGHISLVVPSSGAEALNDIEKLKLLRSRLCLFLLLTWADIKLLADPPSMFQGEVTFPETSITAESREGEDNRVHELLGLRTAEAEEIIVHPRIAFGLQLVPQVPGIVSIPSQMMCLIPDQGLSQSFSIELPDDFDD